MIDRITVTDLSKRFKVYDRAIERLREWLLRAPRHQEHWALRDISFTVGDGEIFGVIGPNGSGKSTLLKILTGVMFPTSGKVQVQGRVVSLLELGTGFNPELSGRENIVNSARLLQLGEDFIRSKMKDIVNFAEVGSYIEHPIKFYSSGMLVRLAFAIFANVDPDVFIIDEALSVGDIYFQQKCFRRIEELKKRGCTMLFVSHDLDAVRRLCSRAMYLDAGDCRAFGPAVDVVDLFIAAMTPGARAAAINPSRVRADTSGAVSEMAYSRIGSGDVTIESVTVCDKNGMPGESFECGQTMRVEVEAMVHRSVHEASFGLLIYDRFGTVVAGTTSEMIDERLFDLEAGTRVRYAFDIQVDLQIGQYSIDLDIGAHDANGLAVPCDRLSGCGKFEISGLGGQQFHGMTPLTCSYRITTLERGGRSGVRVEHVHSERSRANK
jgi:lipopolysaccharide transport system ATP-binding protein